jgi:hypothetical protein
MNAIIWIDLKVGIIAILKKIDVHEVYSTTIVY